MNANSEHVEVGIVINTFGVKGEIKVMSLTDNPSDFSNFKKIYLAKPGEELVEYGVRKARSHKKWAILRLNEIETRDQAAKLRDYSVFIAGSDLGQLSEGTYYQKDLQGIEVYDTKDEFIGVISDILETKANDVYQIRSESGRQILIPAIKDVIKEVDIAANRMVIDPIQGLF